MEFFKQILWKSSPLKPLVRFGKNFTEMFLGWPFSISQICSLGDPFLKTVRKILIRRKTWPWWRGGRLLASSGVNNFLNNVLLLHHLADLDQPWLECSLGGPLQKLFTEFDFIKNSGCHGNQMEFIKKFFEKLLLWNRWSDFEIISQICSLGDPFQKLFAKFWYVEKHGRCGGGGSWRPAVSTILFKSSPLKPLVRFWNNFTDMFLGLPFSKIVREILIRQKTWPLWRGRLLASSGVNNSIKIFSSETGSQILK